MSETTDMTAQPAGYHNPGGIIPVRRGFSQSPRCWRGLVYAGKYLPQVSEAHMEMSTPANSRAYAQVRAHPPRPQTVPRQTQPIGHVQRRHLPRHAPRRHPPTSLPLVSPTPTTSTLASTTRPPSSAPSPATATGTTTTTTSSCTASRCTTCSTSSTDTARTSPRKTWPSDSRC